MFAKLLYVKQIYIKISVTAQGKYLGYMNRDFMLFLSGCFRETVFRG